MRNLGRSPNGDFVAYLTEREVAQLLGFDVPSDPGAQQALDDYAAKPATEVVAIVQENSDAAKLRRTGKNRLQQVKAAVDDLSTDLGNLIGTLP